MDDYPGPIYERVYHSICLTEELINVIILAAIDFGWTEDDPYEAELVDIAPLAEVIDRDEAREWMRQRIKDTEKRFASVVMELLEEDSSRFELIESAACSFGEHYAIDPDLNAREAWAVIESHLLDGMPEDENKKILMSGVYLVEWQQTKDCHSNYWEEAGGEGEYYYILREKMIEGMLQESRVRLEMVRQGHYRLIMDRSSD